MARNIVRSITASCLLIGAVSICSQANSEPLWQQLTSRSKIEADPTADYSIKDSNGPWMVMAATFSGEGAEDQARDLVLELRGKHRLPAYIHKKTFNFSADAPMRGSDRYGRMTRAKYRKGNSASEIAVLVGDFPSIEDAEAQSVLKRIKKINPTALSKAQATSQNLAGLRTSLSYVKSKQATKRFKLTPMDHAFLSRNPILPKEFFVPKGVDKFVAKMNGGVKHSLLNSKGRYTVKVATFRGKTAIKSASRGSSKKNPQKGDPLVIAAENAHLLTIALRKRGWTEESGFPAYEFHDRTESYVAIGSFDKVVKDLPGGRKAALRDVQKILRAFGAAYPEQITDANRLSTQRNVESIKQQFNSVFTQSHGQVASGYHPKSLVGIPFDIHPHAIETPRRSISSIYAH